MEEWGRGWGVTQSRWKKRIKRFLRSRIQFWHLSNHMEIEGMLKKILRQDAQEKGRKFPCHYCQEKKKQHLLYSTAEHLSDQEVWPIFSRKATVIQPYIKTVFNWWMYIKCLTWRKQNLKGILQRETVLTLFHPTLLSIAHYTFWQQEQLQIAWYGHWCMSSHGSVLHGCSITAITSQKNSRLEGIRRDSCWNQVSC